MTAEQELDSLLDDALEDFEAAGRRRPGPAAPAALGAATAASGGGSGDGGAMEEAWAEAAGGEAPALASSSSAVSSRGHEGITSSLAGGPKGLGFDPLSRRPRRAGGAGAPVGGPQPVLPAVAPGSGGPQAGGIDVLSDGLSKLLAELAQADEESNPSSDDPVESATLGAAGPGEAGQQQQQQQQQRDINATLQALSEQAPSFGGGGGDPGNEEEMLRLLAEHLGALGGGMGGGPAGAAGGEGGGGAGGDAAGGLGAAPEMGSLVNSIMQQLLSKEVLYQPMKDIGAKYPEWLAANKDKLSAEDHERYERQHGFIQRICQLYESNPSDFGNLVDLLQQMQQCGQPPQEIVDELAPGMQFGPDGLPTFGGGDDSLPPELKDCTIM